MSIITFWSEGKEETAKTLSLSAIATFMAIEHNCKILIDELPLGLLHLTLL